MSQEPIIRTLTSSSNLRQRELCPGSAAAEEGIPNQDNVYSSEGTLMHEHDANPEKDRSGLTEEQQNTLKLARQLDDEIFSAIISEMEIDQNEPFVEGHEEERWFRKGFKSLFVGHNDYHIFYPNLGLVIVIDKKFGRTPVTGAESNRQLMSYAVMAGEAVDAKHVIVAVNQPRVAFDERVTVAHYDREALKAAKELIISIYDNAHNADGSPRQDAPRVAGEEQCRWCKAKLSCDAYRAKYEILVEPASFPKETFIEKLHSLTDQQLDQVFVAVKFADMIADAAKDEILKRMTEGGMQNYITSSTGSTASITDNSVALKLLMEAGLPLSSVARPKTNEDLADAWQEVVGGTQKAAKETIKKILEPVMEFKPKSPSLKRTKALTN